MRWVHTEEDELELELFRHLFESVVELVGEREVVMAVPSLDGSHVVFWDSTRASPQISPSPCSPTTTVSLSISPLFPK